MGFRCPSCNEDFGKSKEKFDIHTNQCGFGVTAIIIAKVRNICEKKDNEVAYEEYRVGRREKNDEEGADKEN